MTRVPQAPELLTRTVSLGTFEIRAGEDDHGFSGNACPSGVVDAYGTLFRPGCWAAGGLDGERYALCWYHDPTEPVGTFTAEDRTEGLYITGDWDDTPAGQSARHRALAGSAGELSVGFREAIFAEDAPTEIVAVKLVEVSQITARMAAVPGAAMSEARSHSADRMAMRAARARLLLATAVVRTPS